MTAPISSVVCAGSRHGRWTVLSFSHKSSSRNSYFNCRCDCGAERAVKDSRLKDGVSQSCGCLMRERVAAAHTRHGHYLEGQPSLTYRSWCSMKSRCSNPLDPSYPLYGGRGIAVCSRWQVFEHFLADMGERPSVSHSIERTDTNGGYEPDNCIWATSDVQSKNKRVTPRLTKDGVTLTNHRWAQQVGLDAALIASRQRRGWTDERALTQPVQKRRAR
jgi:hypothetical protein